MFRMNVVLTVNQDEDVDEIRGLLTEIGRISRTEPGCERFDVYASQSEPNVFILCEWWESEDAWKTHREAAAAQEIYLPKVLPRVTRVPHISDLLT